MLISTVIIFASLITALRLFFYVRAGARYRPWVSVLAYGLMVGSVGQVIDVALHPANATVSQAILGVSVAILIVSARGNVGKLVTRWA